MHPTPQRLNTMTQGQLIQRVMQLEAANEKCGEAIAAAVQAEREACAVTSETCNRDDWSHSFDTDWRDIIAAAIRARNGGK